MENRLQEHRLVLPLRDVLRAMGYPPHARPVDAVVAVCREQIGRASQLADPWGTRVGMVVENIRGGRLHLRGRQVLNSPRLARIVRGATDIDICLVTLGTRITDEIRRLVAANCMVEAVALDAAASVATHSLIGVLRRHSCAAAEARNCGTTITYGPGYTGWSIEDLPILFACVGGKDVPVRLTPTLMMIPEKSLLCVVGVVPGRRHAATVVACRLCDLEHCSLRQVPYNPGRGRRSTMAAPDAGA